MSNPEEYSSLREGFRDNSEIDNFQSAIDGWSIRAIPRDSVIFLEAITHYYNIQRLKPPKRFHNEHKVVNYILFDTPFKREIRTSFFIIKPTYTIDLGGEHYSYISAVVLPEGWQDDNSHLFTIALASIVSFLLNRPVKSYKTDFGTKNIPPKEDFDIISNYSHEHAKEIAMEFPIQFGKNYASEPNESTLINFEKQLQKFNYEILNLPYTQYKRIMQAVRLSNLAYLSHREDFSLAYYLLVSSIEVIATKAIKNVKITEDPKWKNLAEVDEDFKRIYSIYNNAKTHIGLKKRIIEFINKYCPVGEWLNMPLPDNTQQTINWLSELQDKAESEEDKQRYELLKDREVSSSNIGINPTNLSAEEIESVLSDTYKYRSAFTHEGAPPPHVSTKAYNWFFDKISRRTARTPTKDNSSPSVDNEIIVATFRLLGFIATTSITKYVASLKT